MIIISNQNVFDKRRPFFLFNLLFFNNGNATETSHCPTSRTHHVWDGRMRSCSRTRKWSNQFNAKSCRQFLVRKYYARVGTWPNPQTEKFLIDVDVDLIRWKNKPLVILLSTTFLIDFRSRPYPQIISGRLLNQGIL